MDVMTGFGLLGRLDLIDPRAHAGLDLKAMWRQIRRASSVLWHPVADGRF